MPAAVAIKQVHKHFGNLHALRGIEFEIGRGEYFGLLGPNGAGKSTLINTVAGLVRPDRGAVTVLGFDVVRDYRNARRSVGIVPQELVFDPFFTVREMLRLQAGYFGLGRDNEGWIEELLHRLNLAEKAEANLQDLSGGMKRRVLIAQAMVHKPPVLVLDEPTAGVDVELRQALWGLTRQLHGEGHTIILTTHYLEEAEALCQRIAILNHGRLVALDSKEALLSCHPYRQLVVTVRDHQRCPLRLRPLLAKQEGNQIMLRLHRTHDPIGVVLNAFRDEGIEILDLRTQDAGLEDVFLRLTGDRGGAGEFECP